MARSEFNRRRRPHLSCILRVVIERRTCRRTTNSCRLTGLRTTSRKKRDCTPLAERPLASAVGANVPTAISRESRAVWGHPARLRSVEFTREPLQRSLFTCSDPPLARFRIGLCSKGLPPENLSSLTGRSPLSPHRLDFWHIPRFGYCSSWRMPGAD